MEEEKLLHILKWLIFIALVLLVILVGLFVQEANAEAIDKTIDETAIDKNHMSQESFASVVQHIEEAAVNYKDYANEIVDGAYETQASSPSTSDLSNINSKIMANAITNTATTKITNAADITNKNTANETDIINQMLSGFDKIKQNSCALEKQDGLHIFISFSMPKTLLKQYDDIAKKIGAKLVLRGFKNNSFKETINYIQEISSQGIAIEVNPVLFQKFSVNVVPSFVLSDGEKFDKLVGNVSINYALEKLSDSGDLAQNAKAYLERFKAHENK